MNDELAGRAAAIAKQAAELAKSLSAYADAAAAAAAAPVQPAAAASGHMPFITLLTIFALACFVGYYVVWRVTPALHSPLMAVTNAISSVIVVGALLAAGLAGGTGAETTAKIFGFVAVTLAAVNIFGGFIVTQRMLSMFKKKTVPVKK
ncbi:NAD(P) transhydrogenase subunit alpha [Reyranella sp. CPCC 100927]|uniref:NAD(P) transhydrogenase subunit alpha n=1 Tax=Reyranella sp. CPCC 100927 TaxID=2599616 RepID=UPI0011B6F862|nr:NAD(P) transhydrogenase subunit alpha [Reyranella sp. CPCC 100927]TWT03944.1 NAD(P) transhydrogenase subunit alpha [Reyranella sp. CPCC 100927]